MFASFLDNTGVHTDDREFGISLEDYFGVVFFLHGTDHQIIVIGIIDIKWVVEQLILISKQGLH